MSACTFFGHRDAPSDIRPSLSNAITELIENCSVECFYIGRQGSFDLCAPIRKNTYPQIRFYIVPERLEVHRDSLTESICTILPEGIELTHPRFAILKRNEWMLKHSDYVITYVTRSFGGAARFEKMAQRLGQHIIKLA